MIFLLIAVSDSCAGALETRAGAASCAAAGGGGGALAQEHLAIPGHGGAQRLSALLRAGTLAIPRDAWEQVFPSSLFVIITFRLF